jgi:L-arabinose isomerase
MIPASRPLRAGLLGIGLDTYWPQFAGLKERLEGYVAQVAEKLARPGVEICNAGLVDSPERAVEAGGFFRRSEVDIIFLQKKGSVPRIIAFFLFFQSALQRV